MILAYPSNLVLLSLSPFGASEACLLVFTLGKVVIPSLLWWGSTEPCLVLRAGLDGRISSISSVCVWTRPMSKP